MNPGFNLFEGHFASSLVKCSGRTLWSNALVERSGQNALVERSGQMLSLNALVKCSR